MLLEDVVRLHLPTICHGYDIVSSHAIRVTREAGGPSRPARGRRRAMAVRLQVDDQAPSDVLALLRAELGLSDDDIHAGAGVVAMSGLAELHAAVVGWRRRRSSSTPRPTAAMRGPGVAVSHDAGMPALARRR
jgi:polyphosphate kinase